MENKEIKPNIGAVMYSGTETYVMALLKRELNLGGFNGYNITFQDFQNGINYLYPALNLEQRKKVKSISTGWENSNKIDTLKTIEDPTSLGLVGLAMATSVFVDSLRFKTLQGKQDGDIFKIGFQLENIAYISSLIYRINSEEEVSNEKLHDGLETDVKGALMNFFQFKPILNQELPKIIAKIHLYKKSNIKDINISQLPNEVNLFLLAHSFFFRQFKEGPKIIIAKE